MKPLQDGGPAFPCTLSTWQGVEVNAGMSLRDWFAGQALCGWASGRQADTETYSRERIASNCYAYADAMLKAREEKP